MSIKSGKSNSKLNYSPYLNGLNTFLNSQVDQLLRVKQDPNISSISTSFQRLYKNVEFLCRSKHQQTLTEDLYSKIELFENQLIDEFSHNAPTASSIQLLTSFTSLIDVIQYKSKVAEKIYLYLDRTYLLNHPKKQTVQDYFLSYLRLKLFEYDTELGYLIFSAAVELLNQFRDSSDPEIERVLAQFFTKLTLFIRDMNQVEADILDASITYFQEKRQEILESNETHIAFNLLLRLIENEIKLWSNFEMSSKFKLRIKNTVVYQLLFKDFETSAPVIVASLLEAHSFSDLHCFFKFIICDSKINPEYIKIYASVWSKYVIDYTTNILSENSPEVIDQLVNAKKQFNRIVQNFLENDSTIEFKTRDAFQTALDVSQASININERLLKYLDGFFRHITTDDAESITTLNDAFTIFKSIKSKELFLENYQKALSRRLIMVQSKSIPLEKQFLELLRSEVGIEESKALFTMINDYEKSEHYHKLFRQLSLHESIEFNPLVLNSQAWKPSKTYCHIPTDLSDILSDFKSFYHDSQKYKYEHQHKLQWAHGLSYMTINGSFKKGDKELQVTTPQGLVLLAFNDSDSLKYDEIKGITGLDSKNLSGALYSLTSGKHKILLKDTNHGNNVIYKFNENFQDKKKVIKIKQIQMKLRTENTEDYDDMPDDPNSEYIDNEKDEYVKAFIVRLMKSFKIIQHSELLIKVLDNYNIAQKDVKRSIDQLISQEYIKRVGPDTYHYVP